MKKIKMIEISVAFGLVLTLAFSVVSFGISCNSIRDDVVRLHILANSDSDIDQKVKLTVRDKLLRSGNELFSGNMTVETAYDVLSDNKNDIEAYINNILSEEGFDYCSRVQLVKEYYPTRTYETFTLPAGEYLSLKVILGNGEGNNWWCVMFPPLCLPAATENTDINAVFDDDGVKIVKSSYKYEIRFKIIEIFERIRSHND
ncbi:MAG: stage II sporulation protein R [Clostridia bacterium]|nr:stage II sporulation protein R [Clostridia bacterium]